MNLNQIEAFVKIANNKSFSRTAKELFLTQPTVSVYITNLENELGVQLFTRTTKVVELTEEGKKFYLHAREMLELSHQIMNTFQGTGEDEFARELVIAASRIPAQYLLPKLLSEYSRRYPQIRFRIIEADNESVLSDVADHKADLGFTGSTNPRLRCDFLPFYDDEIVLITPNTQKYRDLRDSEESLDWISGENFVLRESGSGARMEPERHMRELIPVKSVPRVIASFASTDAILTSVKEGLGICLISRLAARERIERGELLAFSLPGGGHFRKLYLVTSQTHPLTEPSRKMISLVNTLYLS